VRLGCAAACLVFALGAGSASADEPGPASFDYLYIEANEGGSSGGHVAIRFGAETFHFQHHGGGMLRLQRDHSDAFIHTYTRLRNRPIHAQRVAVTPETYALLRRRFSDRLVLEARQFAILASLQADRDLLTRQGDAGSAPATVPLRAAGLFAVPDAAHVANGAYAAVISAARARFGDDILVRRRDEIARALAALLIPSGEAVEPPPRPHAYAAAPESFTQRAAELLEARTALDVLEGGGPLRADVVRSAELDELALDDGEVAALRAFAGRLEERAADLVGSRRPDYGSALLLALARLGTVARSVHAHRLALLDAYQADAPRLEPAELDAHATVLPVLLDEARAELAAARRVLRGSALLREADFTALESAGNRFLELHAASAHGSALRLASGPLLPSRSAPGTLPDVAPGIAPDERAALAHAAERRADEYATELQRLYGYDLLTRNCVSEIFREIAAALAADDLSGQALACTGSDARLGGCIDPAARLRFIPFLAANAVAAEYQVIASDEVPSYRDGALAAMYARENDLAVFLRESNVISSTIYRPRAADSPFLFFTDDTVLTRPLFGAVNLVVGLGASAAGVLLLPTGDAELLLRGLRGTLFSLPELAFANIRKGSFAHVPRTAPAPPDLPTHVDS